MKRTIPILLMLGVTQAWSDTQTIQASSNQFIQQVAASSCLTGKINYQYPGDWYTTAQLIITSHCSTPQKMDQTVVTFNSNSTNLSAMWGGPNSSSAFTYQGDISKGMVQAQAVINASEYSSESTLQPGKTMTLYFGANTHGTPFKADSVQIIPAGPTPPPVNDGEIDITFNAAGQALSGTAEVSISSPVLSTPIVVNNTQWSSATTYKVQNLAYGNYTISAKNVADYAATVTPSSVNVQGPIPIPVGVSYAQIPSTGSLTLTLGQAPLSNIPQTITATLHDETKNQDQAVTLTWNQSTTLTQLPANEVYSVKLPRVTNGKQYADANASGTIKVVANKTVALPLNYQGAHYWNTQPVSITFLGLKESNANLIITDAFQNRFEKSNLGNGTITQDLPVNNTFAITANAPGLSGTATPANFTLSEGKTPPDVQVNFSAIPTSNIFYAPYIDMTLWPTPDLVKIAQDSGNNNFSLAFIVSNGSCVPKWGGIVDYNDPSFVAPINNLFAAGGDVAISFGGANGTELAQACKTVTDLKNAYQTVTHGLLSSRSIKRVDFDIEGWAIADTVANERRAQAIAQMQKADPSLKVSFTLPVLPTGITHDGVNLLKTTIAQGVTIDYVNIMAMDYGGSNDHMGQSAIDAMNSLFAQLKTIYADAGQPKTDAQLWRMIGVTPMIGVNDVQGEVFNLTVDAPLVKQFVKQNQIGFMGFWSMTRDKACPQPSPWANPTCSGITQAPYAFTKALNPAG